MAAHCNLYALHLTTHETFTGPSESTLVTCSNYTPKGRCEQEELHTKLFVLPAAASLFPHWSQIFFLFQGPHRTQPFLSKGHLGHFPLLPQRILNSILQILNLPSFAFAFLRLMCRGKEHILWDRVGYMLKNFSVSGKALLRARSHWVVWFHCYNLPWCRMESSRKKRLYKHHLGTSFTLCH